VIVAFLLTGCGNNVVVQPVAIKPVSADLMRSPGVPRCQLPERNDYAPSEIIAYSECWKAAYHALAARHIGLQRAVSVRQAATAKAVKASKGS
jgi:hypothetical protein